MSDGCRAEIWDTGAFHPRRCSRAAQPGTTRCKIHSPEAQAKRDAARTERWKAQNDKFHTELNDKKVGRELRGHGLTEVSEIMRLVDLGRTFEATMREPLR